jgi:uracil-DNA glycosylase
MQNGTSTSSRSPTPSPVAGGSSFSGTPHQQLAGWVDQLAGYLAFQKENGVTAVDVSPEQVAALSQLADGKAQMARAPQAQAVSARAAGAPVESAAGAAASRAGRSGGGKAAEPDGDLAEIAERIARCPLCGLCETRTRTVPGQGASRPELMFVGEGPGADEDAQGLAFVGRAGQLLTKIIEAMGLAREEVWIGNIVKCRPPNNRAPTQDEMDACMPYLHEQIALLQPKVMVCLGGTAVKGLFHQAEGITKMRGRWLEFDGIAVMPTFHPAYLLRNPPAKREVWEDMKAVLQRLGRPVPKQPGGRG